MIFPAGQFVSVRNDMIFWIFAIVPCHAFACDIGQLAKIHLSICISIVSSISGYMAELWISVNQLITS